MHGAAGECWKKSIKSAAGYKQKSIFSKFFLSLLLQRLSQNRTPENPTIFASIAHVRPINGREVLFLIHYEKNPCKSVFIRG
jgi:hypothetical protein